MKCSEFKRRFLDYLDGNLSDYEKKFFDEHISSCYECSTLVKDLTFLRNEVKKIKIPSPNPFNFEVVKARLKQKVFPKVFALKITFASSFSLVLLFTLFFHFINKSKDDYAKKYVKMLYIIQEKKSGYYIPVYNVENNYIFTRGGSTTF